MPEEKVFARVAAELQLAEHDQKKPPKIFVRGDEHVDYGQVVKAMSLLQRAGADEVGLMTEPAPDDNKKNEEG